LLAQEGTFDYLVIESTGVSEPLPVAETFTFEVAPGDADAKEPAPEAPPSASGGAIPSSLADLARLDTLVTVVDASSFLQDLDTLDDLADRGWEDRGGDAAHEHAHVADGKDDAVGAGTPDGLAGDARAGEADEPEAAEAETGKGDSDGSAVAKAETGKGAAVPEAEAAADAAEEDEEGEEDKGISALLVEQVEFANVVVINKCDLVSAEELERVEAVVRGLNPGATVVRSVRGNVPVESVMDTGLFSMEAASSAAGWLKEARGEHVPETEEYGVSSFVFRSKRPFHPGRLALLLESDAFSSGKPPAGKALTATEPEAAPPAEAAGAKDADCPDVLRRAFDGSLGFIIRSKGIAWLAGAPAGSNAFAGEWSHAGRRVAITPVVPWAAAALAAGEDGAPTPSPEGWDRDPRVGDRHSEVVIIGLSVTRDAFSAALSACLLTDKEWEAGPEAWGAISDPIWGELDWEGFAEGIAGDGEHMH